MEPTNLRDIRSTLHTYFVHVSHSATRPPSVYPSTAAFPCQSDRRVGTVDDGSCLSPSPQPPPPKERVRKGSEANYPRRAPPFTKYTRRQTDGNGPRARSASQSDVSQSPAVDLSSRQGAMWRFSGFYCSARCRTFMLPRSLSLFPAPWGLG